MTKFVLFGVAVDGAAWMYDPKVGGVLFFTLLIFSFVFATVLSTSTKVRK